MQRVWTLGRAPQAKPLLAQEQVGPDWAEANPKRIKHALEQALSKPSGGWYVIDASRAIKDKPRLYRICGRELVVWRTANSLHVAPDACPHMGASLASGCVVNNRLRCPWHGLALGNEGHGAWKPYPSYDDGVLLWVRLDDLQSEAITSRPILTKRPEHFLDAVIRVEANCEPQDVIANRLDPWHGVHFHPHSFARLTVLERNDEAITVRVAYRVIGPLSVEVDARFHCPEPRTIVMTIVDGEGVGSVVETHATPIAPGRTAIVEATLATSDRVGFKVAMKAATLVRPWVAYSAKRLWIDDAAYAERQYQLRHLA